jgi:putative MATE family efflux protein
MTGKDGISDLVTANSEIPEVMFSNSTLRKLIVPLFMEQLLIIGVSMIATMMVSYAGEAAVSGVSIVEMINFLLINVLAALATGGAVVVSQYIGNKDMEHARKASNQLILTTSMISVFFLLLVVIFHKPVLMLLFGKVEPQVMDAAVVYFLLSGLSYPFLAVYNSCAALFRSMGKSHITMGVSIVMNVMNVIGISAGIFIFKTGVMGVGISALLSRMLAAAIMIVKVQNKTNEVHVELAGVFKWNREMAARILGIAIPNGIENGLFQLGKVLLVSIIALFGTAQIAANGVGNSLAMLSISFALAMNLAIVTVIGQCVGSGDYSEAERYLKKLMKITYIGNALMGLAILIFLPVLLKLYTVSDEAIRITYSLILVHNPMSILIWPVSFTLSNALRASGDVRYTMVVSIGSMILFRLVFSYILGVVFNLGVLGVWIAMCIDWVARAFLFGYRLKSGKWKEFRVI